MKYKGIYKLKPNLDSKTNDFPRSKDGSIDKSYDDIFISCYNNCQIYNYGKGKLQAYIPSIGRGHNILIAMYEDTIGNVETVGRDYPTIYKQLTDSGLIFDIEETDEEILFKFKASNIETIAKYLKPSTKGANRSPFSTKNLPRSKYEIPMEDLALYKEITASIPEGNIRIYSIINDEFLNSLTSKKLKLEDIKADMKFKGLKTKEYFHSIGKWEDYIKFFKKKLNEIGE